VAYGLDENANASHQTSLGLALRGLAALILEIRFSFTAGVLFYLKKRVRYFHFVFHLFILAGSICHFFSFLFLIEF